MQADRHTHCSDLHFLPNLPKNTYINFNGVRANLALDISCGYSKQEPPKSIQRSQFKYNKKKTPHPSFQNGKEKKNGRKKSHTVTHDLDVMLRMLYGKLLDNLAWDLYVASTVCVPPSTVKSLVTLGRLYFIAKCSVLELLVKFLSKSAEAYPADFNINLILLAMSIFVVHIYACSNTIS